jgi:transposase-like protein
MDGEYPDTMQLFFKQFPDDLACLQYLAKIRWGSGFICPRCAHAKAWKKSCGLYRCASCRHDTSVTAGTIFGDSRVPINIWFQAVWLVVSQKSGVSALGLSRAVGIKRQKTGWFLLKRIRSAMVRIGRERLNGLVEIDEVFLGGVKPGKRGRGALGKVLVLVAVEDNGKRGIGRIRIVIIPDASATSMQKAIEAMVEPGSTIRTDEWKGYPPITKCGYRHIAIKGDASVPGEDPTALVHRIASLLKRWLLGTHQGGVHQETIEPYLDEFVFRFNRRTSRSRGKLFFRLLQNMVQAKSA